MPMREWHLLLKTIRYSMTTAWRLGVVGRVQTEVMVQSPGTHLAEDQQPLFLFLVGGQGGELL